MRLALAALVDADHAPRHVVVDRRALAGQPDERDDRDVPLRRDVEQVLAVVVAGRLAVLGREPAVLGEQRAQPADRGRIGDKAPSVGCEGVERGGRGGEATEGSCRHTVLDLFDRQYAISRVGNTAMRGQRPHRRPPRRLRHAARARGRQPLLRTRVPARGRDDPRRRRSASPSSCAPGGCRAARDRRGIEAKLRELVETGQIAELAELERELAPGIVGLGRYLGLGAKRSVEIARALDVRTPEELREAAADGRLRDVPGVGPKIEAQLLAALAARAGAAAAARAHVPARPRAHRRASPRRWTARWPATRAAGSTRRSGSRWCAPPRDPAPLLARFAALPQVVALLERGSGARSA